MGGTVRYAPSSATRARRPARAAAASSCGSVQRHVVAAPKAAAEWRPDHLRAQSLLRNRTPEIRCHARRMRWRRLPSRRASFGEYPSCRLLIAGRLYPELRRRATQDVGHLGDPGARRRRRSDLPQTPPRRDRQVTRPFPERCSAPDLCPRHW